MCCVAFFVFHLHRHRHRSTTVFVAVGAGACVFYGCFVPVLNHNCRFSLSVWRSCAGTSRDLLEELPAVSSRSRLTVALARTHVCFAAANPRLSDVGNAMTPSSACSVLWSGACECASELALSHSFCILCLHCAVRRSVARSCERAQVKPCVVPSKPQTFCYGRGCPGMRCKTSSETLLGPAPVQPVNSGPSAENTAFAASLCALSYRGAIRFQRT